LNKFYFIVDRFWVVFGIALIPGYVLMIKIVLMHA